MRITRMPASTTCLHGAGDIEEGFRVVHGVGMAGARYLVNNQGFTTVVLSVVVFVYKGYYNYDQNAPFNSGGMFCHDFQSLGRFFRK